MALSMKLGLRNLQRRPTRTIITGSMIAISTLMLVYANAISEGSYTDMVTLATGTWTGQVQVLAEGYEESPSLFEAVEEPAAVIEKLEALPEVKAAVPRVEFAGLLSIGTRSAGALITGVDVEAETDAFTLPKAVKQGTWLGPVPDDPEAYPIVVGSGLAQRIGAELGTELVYVGQAADGSMAAELFVVVGLLDSGSAEIDSSTAYVKIEHAQELLVLGKRVHRIAVLLNDIEFSQPVADAFEAGEGMKTMSWIELMPALERTISGDRAGSQLIIVVIVFVVLLGVANSMLMSVFERTRELGIMKAVGTSPGRLIGIVVWESAWLSIVGVLFGVALGAIAVYFTMENGIQMSEEPMEFGGASISTIRPIFTFTGMVIYPGIVAVVGALAGFWPALRAAQLDPVTAIRD